MAYHTGRLTITEISAIIGRNIVQSVSKKAQSNRPMKVAGSSHESDRTARSRSIGTHRPAGDDFAGIAPRFFAGGTSRTWANRRFQGSTSNGQIRDLRDLLWASIDNDDSRDLDQLTVAESLPGGQGENSRGGGRC